jgi:hypothetical protein
MECRNSNIELINVGCFWFWPAVWPENLEKPKYLTTIVIKVVQNTVMSRNMSLFDAVILRIDSTVTILFNSSSENEKIGFFKIKFEIWLEELELD